MSGEKTLLFYFSLRTQPGGLDVRSMIFVFQYMISMSDDTGSNKIPYCYIRQITLELPVIFTIENMRIKNMKILSLQQGHTCILFFTDLYKYLIT